MTNRHDDHERIENKLRTLARNAREDDVLLVGARDLRTLVDVLDCAREGLRVAQGAHMGKVYECEGLRAMLSAAKAQEKQP